MRYRCDDGSWWKSVVMKFEVVEDWLEMLKLEKWKVGELKLEVWTSWMGYEWDVVDK